MHDEELIRLLNEDANKGMTWLMREYTALVTSVVKGKLSRGFTAEDVEECVSDVFCDFYRKREWFDPKEGTVRGFLCMLAKHRAVDLCRRRTPPISDTGEGEELADAEQLSVEEEYINGELRRELIGVIEALGEPDREIIVRKYFLMQSSKEIAAALGISVSVVNTRVHRAIKKLRKKLGGYFQ